MSQMANRSNIVEGTITVDSNLSELILPFVPFEPKVIYVYAESKSEATGWRTYRAIYTRDMTTGMNNYNDNAIVFEENDGSARYAFRTLNILQNETISIPVRGQFYWDIGTYHYIIAG